MNSRLNKIKEYMKEKALDSLLVTDRKNMRYLASYTGEGYLVVAENANYLVTDSRYTEQAKKQTSGFEIFDIADFEPKDVFGSFESTGFENESISFSRYSAYSKIFKSLVPIDGIILEMRAIKDDDELEKIRMAEHIGDMAFEHILPFIKPGVSERELATEIEYFMKKNGAEDLSFGTIVATGAHGAMPHAEPDSRLIGSGDFVTMDFGCVYEGYCGDMTRTVCVGKANPDMKDVYNTVLKAQTECIEMLRAGVKGCDVHNRAKQIIDEHYAGRFGHGLGHGVGLDVHEMPGLSPRYTGELAVNTVVTVEPGIYIPEFCGVRIEDLVIIKEEKVVNLTNSPKNLIEI